MPPPGFGKGNAYRRDMGINEKFVELSRKSAQDVARRASEQDLAPEREILEIITAMDTGKQIVILQEEDKRFVFYCAMGWRSALACQVATRMGLEWAAHLDGGFGAWKEAGFDIVAYEKRKT